MKTQVLAEQTAGFHYDCAVQARTLARHDFRRLVRDATDYAEILCEELTDRAQFIAAYLTRWADMTETPVWDDSSEQHDR